jgi:glycosyltransferase involved in cell wall biosynthesis
MKVCFFSPTAYSYFNPDGSNWAGGAEIQQVLIARNMAERNIEVSFIVGDYGQPDLEIFDGIKVIKSFAPFKGNRKIRFIPDMARIRRAMQVADADIFNQRSTSFFTGQISFFAGSLGKAFTFSIGIDYNCYPDCQGLLTWPMPILYRYGIRHADAVIAQTEKQRELLMNNFGQESVLIRNGIAIYEENGKRIANGGSSPKDRPEFLWVGSFRRRKRPELFLELARRIPEADFTLVGGPGDDIPFYREISNQARTIPNLNYEGFVPPGKIEGFYERAYIYINTSVLEGFPNTYLHSWRKGVPVFTMEIDPDSIIEKNGVGVVTGNLDGMIREVKGICRAPDKRTMMSKKSLEYVRNNHDIRDKTEEYINLFEKIILGRSRNGAGG